MGRLAGCRRGGGGITGGEGVVLTCLTYWSRLPWKKRLSSEDVISVSRITPEIRTNDTTVSNSALVYDDQNKTIRSRRAVSDNNRLSLSTKRLSGWFIAACVNSVNIG